MREQATLESKNAMSMVEGSSLEARIRNLPDSRLYIIIKDSKGTIRRTLKNAPSNRRNTGRGNSAALIAEEDQFFKKMYGIGGVK